MLSVLFACKNPNVIELPCLVCWSSRALEESLGPLGSLKKNRDFEGQYSARRILENSKQETNEKAAIGIPMVLLPSHQLQLQTETSSMPPKA